MTLRAIGDLDVQESQRRQFRILDRDTAFDSFDVELGHIFLQAIQYQRAYDGTAEAEIVDIRDDVGRGRVAVDG